MITEFFLQRDELLAQLLPGNAISLIAEMIFRAITLIPNFTVVKFPTRKTSLLKWSSDYQNQLIIVVQTAHRGEDIITLRHSAV